MEILIIIPVFLFYIIVYYLEAKHDNVQRLQLQDAMKFSRYMKPFLDNKQEAWSFEQTMISHQSAWHKWDFIKQASLGVFWGLLVSFILNDAIYMLLAVIIGLERLLFFNIFLNIVSRNPDKLHLGENKIDKFLVKLFGNLWPYVIIILILSNVSAILWLHIPIFI